MLSVPYYSQEDADAAKYRNDCGPACVGMILTWAGKGHIPINTLSAETSLYTSDTGLAVYPVAKLLTSNGLPAQMRANTTVDQIRTEVVTNQRPVIALINYAAIPERLNKADVLGHYVVVIGFDDNNVYVNDPDFYGAQRSKGDGLALKLSEFTQGFMGSDPAQYAIFLTGEGIVASPPPTNPAPVQPPSVPVQPPPTNPTPVQPPVNPTPVAPVPTPPNPSGPAYVNAPSGINLRDAPASANVIEKVPFKQAVTLFADDPISAPLSGTPYTWVRIQTQAGHVGWCAQQYITLGAPPTA